MTDANPVTSPLDPNSKLEASTDEVTDLENIPYQELIGSLLYLATCTRPDISYAVNYLTQYNTRYNSTHWTAAKRVLWYLKGTADIGFIYKKTEKTVEGYVDADWANCTSDRRSYTGYAFILSGCPIAWESRKQKTVALSSTEAEYMALTEAAKQATYLRHFLLELGFNTLAEIKVFCDNNGARKLPRTPYSIVKRST
ncbi:secreted RxLR effector protein 161-like [Monomorium pharaonis]|uniref:secreted RxLR effector protein 161-like n=1 Tax=Monomorium pharaonis TaxID=307658 RepID=UPI0017476A7B|nr:secreted RxLR effector protein 161-like [Monomorium pharaonis]